MQITKKILLSTIAISTLALTSVSLATPTTLHTDNYSRFYIATEVNGFCSTLFGLGHGVTGPGTPGTANATWSQVTQLCKSTSCVATTKSFTSNPGTGLLCPGGTVIATATMNTYTGAIAFTNVLSGWTFSNNVSGDISTVTIHSNT